MLLFITTHIALVFFLVVAIPGMLLAAASATLAYRLRNRYPDFYYDVGCPKPGSPDIRFLRKLKQDSLLNDLKIVLRLSRTLLYAYSLLISIFFVSGPIMAVWRLC